MNTHATNVIARAERFAREAHEGQFRTDGVTPYITHPEQVAEILAVVSGDPEVIAAGWLHDTLEDTDTKPEQLIQEFGKRITRLVWEVTHEEHQNGAYFPRLESREGIMIKFADRLSNLSDMSDWDDKKIAWYLGKSKFWASEPKEQK